MDRTSAIGIIKVFVTLFALIGVEITPDEVATIAGAWAIIWTAISAAQAYFSKDKADGPNLIQPTYPGRPLDHIEEANLAVAKERKKLIADQRVTEKIKQKAYESRVA